MRDMESDKKAGKNTIVVKMGLAKAKMLHIAFVSIAFISTISFFFVRYSDELWNRKIESPSIIIFLPLLAFIPLFIHLVKVKRTKSLTLLDPELKKVALSTFLFAILCVVSVWILA
jgi:1,4-dihydroxy-2-naphthoate octaprenyltransferase